MPRVNLVIAGSDGTIGGPGGSALDPTVLTYTGNVPILKTIIVPQPAFGAEWLLSIPANATQAAAAPWNINGATSGLWVRIASGFTTFSTSAVVANRYPGIALTDNNGIAVGQYMQQGSAYAAGVTNGHHMYTRTPQWIQAANVSPGNTEDAVGGPAFVMPPGWSYGSLTGNIDTTPLTGDRYGAVNLLLQIWTSAPVHSVPGPNL